MPGGLRCLDRRLVSGQDLPYRRTSGKYMRALHVSIIPPLFVLTEKETSWGGETKRAHRVNIDPTHMFPPRHHLSGSHHALQLMGPQL